MDFVKLIREQNIDFQMIYLYGSYVNGYYNPKKSDIDIVAINSKPQQKKIMKIPPNLNIHVIHPTLFENFNYIHSFIFLRMTPQYNWRDCDKLSNQMKSELVRRQLIKFREKNMRDERVIDVLDPIKNYIFEQMQKRPWRSSQFKRLLNSKKSLEILTQEYQKIFDLLEEKEMIISEREKYFINKNYFFDSSSQESKDPFSFKMKKSLCGLHYIKNILPLNKAYKPF